MLLCVGHARCDSPGHVIAALIGPSATGLSALSARLHSRRQEN